MVFISCFISTVILTKMNMLYYDYPIFAVTLIGVTLIKQPSNFAARYCMCGC